MTLINGSYTLLYLLLHYSKRKKRKSLPLFLIERKQRRSSLAMAADVSSLHRVFSGYKDDLTVGNESGGSKSTALITRDLLGVGGGGSASTDTRNDQSQELDLDLHVPNGWEKRLDLKVLSLSLSFFILFYHMNIFSDCFHFSRREFYSS